ncbi:MAG: hypothetical protein K6G10_01505 [Butyrivibrio sp.]|nr:hypothetical protein [Butyrivibrio sp.]
MSINESAKGYLIAAGVQLVFAVVFAGLSVCLKIVAEIFTRDFEPYYITVSITGGAALTCVIMLIASAVAKLCSDMM